MKRTLIIEVQGGNKYNFDVFIKKGDEILFFDDLTQREWIVLKSGSDFVTINSKYVVQAILCKQEG